MSALNRHTERGLGRAHRGLALLLALLISPLAGAVYDPHEPLPATAQPPHGAVTIEVEQDAWGSARSAQVTQLLESVAATFLRYTGAPDQALLIRVESHRGSPRVLFERGADDSYQVLLSAQDQHWYQYAYQFAHELCHIVSHFDHKERNGYDEVASANQWFEESLCETAALFTLRRMSEEWRQQPPSRNWVGYAAVFADYADHLLAQPHRRAGDATLDRWFATHRAALRSTPYDRPHNEVVATRLLQLFEQQPRHWRTLAYLNRDRVSATKEFEGYLADWQQACPPDGRPLVQQTLALFGLAAE